MRGLRFAARVQAASRRRGTTTTFQLHV
jgi:hypothetical protein